MGNNNLNTTRKQCTNCHIVPRGKVVNGLCPACRHFYRRHGRMRTRYDKRVRGKGEKRPFCTNCKISHTSGHRYLCRACYQYRRVNGVDRPSHLWRTSCRVCGKPRVPNKFAHGRCLVCNNYRRRNGRDRDRRLIKELYPHGWCDCGKPATGIVEVGLSGPNGGLKSERLAMCDECARAEQEVAIIAL